MGDAGSEVEPYVEGEGMEKIIKTPLIRILSNKKK